MLAKNFQSVELKDCKKGKYIMSCPFDEADHRIYQVNRLIVYSKKMWVGEVSIGMGNYKKTRKMTLDKWEECDYGYKTILIPDGMNNKIHNKNYGRAHCKLVVRGDCVSDVYCDWKLVSKQ